MLDIRNKRLLAEILGALIVGFATYFSTHETTQEQEQKQFLQQEINFSLNGKEVPVTLEGLPSKVEKLAQESQSCNLRNDGLSTKLETAKATITKLEVENRSLKKQNQEPKFNNSGACQKSLISGGIPNISRMQRKIINKGNFEIEAKKCQQSDTKVICYLSVINKGKKSSFSIHPAHSYIYDISHNKFPASSAKIANGIEKSPVSMVLHNGIQTSAQISFDNFTLNQEEIAVLEIYFVGSVGEFTGVSLFHSLRALN